MSYTKLETSTTRPLLAPTRTECGAGESGCGPSKAIILEVGGGASLAGLFHMTTHDYPSRLGG